MNRGARQRRSSPDPVDFIFVTHGEFTEGVPEDELASSPNLQDRGTCVFDVITDPTRFFS